MSDPTQHVAHGGDPTLEWLDRQIGKTSRLIAQIRRKDPVYWRSLKWQDLTEIRTRLEAVRDEHIRKFNITNGL